jgi:hypothetical protein
MRCKPSKSLFSASTRMLQSHVRAQKAWKLREDSIRMFSGWRQPSELFISCRRRALPLFDAAGISIVPKYAAVGMMVPLLE